MEDFLVMKIPVGGCANGSVGKEFDVQVQDLIMDPQHPH